MCKVFSSILIFFVFLCDSYGGAENLSKDAAKLAEAKEYSRSEKKADREYAADLIISIRSRITSSEVIERLINDSDDEVKIKAYLALDEVASRGVLTIDEAQRFSNLLDSELTEDKVFSAFRQGEGPEQASMFAVKAIALNSLYFNYSLISPMRYYIWQTETYAKLIRIILDKFGVESPEQVFWMTEDLVVPEAIDQCLPSVIKFVVAQPANNCGAYLSALWKQPVFGRNGAMRDKYIKLVSPHAEDLFKKVSSGSSNDYYLEEFVRALREVDK